MLAHAAPRGPCLTPQTFSPNARSQNIAPRRVRLAPVRASSSSNGDSSESALPAAMSLKESYSLLGLKDGASYDQVLDAKGKLLKRFEGQMEKKMQIEGAYDTIFSSQLKARLSGDMPVSNRVRFADVKPPKRPQPPSKPLQLPGGAVSVRPLTAQPAISTSAVFGGLAAWTLIQGLTEASPNAAAADVPGLQLALGLAASVYVLRESKRVGLGKAAGLAAAGLVVGTILGAGVEGWLRVDLVPLGSLSSPGIVVGEFALTGLWAAAFFLA